MEETLRRPRRRPVQERIPRERAPRERDTFLQRVLVQVIVCILVAGFFWGAARMGALGEQRSMLQTVLTTNTDTTRLIQKAEDFAGKNEQFARVWQVIAPYLPAVPTEEEQPAETPPPAAREAAPVPLEAWMAVSKKIEEAFLPPLIGTITSDYGDRVDPFESVDRFHHGIDIAAKAGDAILASSDGEVIFSGVMEGYGNMIKLRHANGYETVYAHCQELFVSEGQYVEAGTRIAAAGSTGRSTGVHLHFEVIINGVRVDPKTVVRFPGKGYV